MPFDKYTATTAGRKGGIKRWNNRDSKTIRNKQINICVSDEEFKKITEKAKALSLSKTEFIVKATFQYKEDLL